MIRIKTYGKFHDRIGGGENYSKANAVVAVNFNMIQTIRYLLKVTNIPIWLDIIFNVRIVECFLGPSMIRMEIKSLVFRSVLKEDL